MNSEKPIFVMFKSPTCPHCQSIEPFFNQYAEEFKTYVIFITINVAENKNIITQYGIMGTPSFIFLCKGKPVSSIVGSVYPALLKKTVEDGLQYGKDCANKTTWFQQGITGYA
jgi:thiol-disulfide isomerase/thioredoxin